jgi:hypothetical protein
MNTNEYDPSGLPPTPRLTEEELAYYRSQINEAEILAEWREVCEGGGYKLEDFIGELEELARQAQQASADKG